MMKRILLITGLTAGLLAACSPGEQEQSKLEQAVENISTDRILADMEYLSDDLFEGRMPGTDGYDHAALFIENQMRKMGLQPAGTEGYMQPFEVVRSRILDMYDPMQVTTADGTSFDIAPVTGFQAGRYFNADNASINGEVVFAGYGITAPNLGYDDYEGLDVEGKVVIFLPGAPDSFNGDATVFYGSSAFKAMTAAENGATGVLILDLDTTTTDEARLSQFEAYKTVYASSSRDREGNIIRRPDSLTGFGTLHYGAAKALFAAGGQDIDQYLENVDPTQIERGSLGVSVSADWTVDRVAIQTTNVAGLIPGTNPELQDEYVILTAHLDHCGIQAGPDSCGRGDREGKGDILHNGFYDNTSGVSITMEIARHLKELGTERSVMILMVSAEEMGLLGAYHFAESPTVPLENIVANVNMDMPILLEPLGSLIPFGAVYSDLNPIVESVAEITGLQVVEDPIPDQGLFGRSDQFPFVAKGVPALFMVPGADPESEGGAAGVLFHFLQTNYHTPYEEKSQAFSHEAAQVYTEFNLRVAYMTANMDQKPRWIENSPFGPIPSESAQ